LPGTRESWEKIKIEGDGKKVGGNLKGKKSGE
jgi:hypothetical protein